MAQTKEIAHKTLVLKCPGLINATEIVKEVTLDALMDFLLDFADTDTEIDDRYYYYLLREKAYSAEEDEDATFAHLNFYSPQERREFIKDPEGHLVRFGHEVAMFLQLTLDRNRDEINNYYGEVLIIDELRVISVTPQHIIIGFTGAIQ